MNNTQLYGIGIYNLIGEGILMGPSSGIVLCNTSTGLIATYIATYTLSVNFDICNIHHIAEILYVRICTHEFNCHDH